MEYVTILWHGPYNLERKHLSDIVEDKGIYTISRVWGNKETLIYIGRTERAFQQRIDEHNYWLSDLKGQIKIRYGIIQLESNKKISHSKVCDIESLLIAFHQPPENTLNSRFYTGRDHLIVINKGRRGLLTSIVSTDDLEWA